MQDAGVCHSPVLICVVSLFRSPTATASWSHGSVPTAEPSWCVSRIQPTINNKPTTTTSSRKTTVRLHTLVENLQEHLLYCTTKFSFERSEISSWLLEVFSGLSPFLPLSALLLPLSPNLLVSRRYVVSSFLVFQRIPT